MTTMTNASTPDPVSGAPGPAERLAGMLSPEAIDGLLADAEAAGTAFDGPDGLLARMTKAVLERALDVEITDHLGYEAGDPAGNGSGNSRNGHGRKTVHTTAGPVELEVPRDRNGSFAPVIVAPSAPGVSRPGPRADRVEIVLVSGRRLLVGAEIEPATLIGLVQVLERA